MAKLKKIDDLSLIHFNLEKLETKVDEFQKYLEMNPITASVTKDNEIILAIDQQDQLHKEILIQIKMQDALFSWMPLLEKLKEREKEVNSVYGDNEIGGMFIKNK